MRFSPSFPIGAIAQLGERVLCKHEVVGSIPSGSTISRVDLVGLTVDRLRFASSEEISISPPGLPGLGRG